ncbi:MAG: hypothetical protein SFW66_06230 [Gammaproteobacteria bacterium]|nr:hypothetical protein [Gammaproteobacteria bacterium]
MNQLTRQLVAFLYLGIVVVLFVAGIVIFSWLLLIGAITGLILFLIAWIRQTFFIKRRNTMQRKPENPGRVIDHDEL